jgi:translation elongation factor EF-G
MGSMHGSPLKNQQPIEIINQMDRPQTHKGHLQNDIYENALKLVEQDNNKSLVKKRNPQSILQKSEYDDQLKEINDYLKEQEYGKAHLQNTPPFNLNEGRQSWNLQHLNDTSKFRISDFKRANTINQPLVKKDLAHE